jgi:hypothetical protein
VPFEVGEAAFGQDLPLRPAIVGSIGSFQDHLVGFEPESRCSGTPSSPSACCEQLTPCQEQICQCGHHIDLAAVLGQTTQPGLLKAELLLDHPEWVLNL